MNILLTGPINVGKTTLLNKLLDLLNQPYTGFYTQTLYENNKVYGYQMCAYSNHFKPFTIGIKETPHTCSPIIEAFELGGVALLDESLKDSKIIVMDELGILESKAFIYQEKVKACLNSNNMVIGIIKKKNSVFLNELRNRDDILLFEVSLNNRDHLLNNIYNVIISKNE